MGNPRIRLGPFLGRWWLVLVLATVGGALSAYLYGSRATPKYEAEAQVLVEAATGGVRQTAGLLPTYGEMVKSTPVLAYALRSARSRASLNELRENVRGESDADTRLISIRADDTDPSRAVALANGLAAGLMRYVSVAAPSPSSSEAAVTSHSRIRVVDPATSAVRVTPRTALLLEFGAAAGLFGAFAFALVVEARGRRVTDEEGFTEIAGMPLLGSVNGAWPRAGTSLLDPKRISPEETTAYRRLVTQIKVANNDDVPDSLVVVGVEGTEASSAVGVKLALALAQEGQRVVLVDLDGAQVRRFFRIGERGGGGQIIKRSEPITYRGTTFDRFTFRWGPPLGLALPRLAPSGLSHEEAEDLVAHVSAGIDILVIHTPPPSRSRAALTWARATSATVLVVRAGHSEYTEVAEAHDGLRAAGTKLIGAVLHGDRA